MVEPQHTVELPPLYKYLDVQGAKLTLGNKTFKHAKPSDFNDLEDLTIQSIFAEDVEAALSKIATGFTEIIANNVDRPPTCGPKLRSSIELLQKIFRENPKAVAIIKTEMANEKIGNLYDIEHMRTISEAIIKEINEFMQDYRVLCVTTHKNSERMWTEYAQDQQGVILRIEPCVEKDSKFRLFRPVKYAEKRPALHDDALEFLEGSLFADQEARIRASIDKIIYAKTTKWEHEGEYRLAIPILAGEKDWFTLPYHSEEITELYLGAVIKEEDKREIVERAKAANPQIEIFQMSRTADGTLKQA